MEGQAFRVTLTRREGYEIAATWDEGAWPELVVDEPPPLGSGHGPNPTRILGAAVGSCLASSLLFCLSKARVTVREFTVHVDGTVARNDQGRLRIASLRVTLAPSVPSAERDRMARCLTLFEDFCTVTASIRQGVPVHVDVVPADEA